MIFVECKPDIALVRWLSGLSKREVVHELKGKGEIANRLQRLRDSKAMVDEDPGAAQHPYYRALVVRENTEQWGLRWLHDAQRNNHVIVLCPRIEEWVLRMSQDAGISPQKYQLPRSAKELHDVVNLDIAKWQRLIQDESMVATHRMSHLRRMLLA